MASLRMEGPFDYSRTSVDKHVKVGRPGNFALGERNERGGLTIGYVGRSDTDLNGELKAHIGEKPFPYFKFGLTLSAGEAYRRHCKNFHDFSMAPKQPHPEKPTTNAKVVCPVCGV